MKKRDLTGQTFGKWTVTGPTAVLLKTYSSKAKFWDCICECGAKQQMPAWTLEKGLSKNCRACRPKLERCKRGHEMTEWGRTNCHSCKACVKHKSLLREYGITLEEFESLWRFQNGRCALCGETISLYSKGAPGWHFEERRPEVDHDHDDNIKDKKASVRGILCGGQWAGCNRKLGKIDNLPWLKAVIAYLENPPAQQLFREKK